MIRKSTFLLFLALSILGCLLLLSAIFKAFLLSINNPTASIHALPETMLVSFMLLPMWGLFCGANLYVSYIFIKAAPKVIIDVCGEAEQSTIYGETFRKLGHILLIAMPSLGICLCLWRLIIV